MLSHWPEKVPEEVFPNAALKKKIVRSAYRRISMMRGHIAINTFIPILKFRLNGII
ncbi:hypothetical protein [Methanococcoides sp. NM1]|uniref:hypothetical protein n=1 Tax=Methanococcoides sp. NM1 TaxID=1201013 RepID=UPI0014382A2E|nr:hypothetical protein [Methanococcoides sp. NM1]